MATYQMAGKTLEAESRYLTLNLRDSTGILDDVQALRQRMDEDGFLLIRDFHSREEVMKVRRGILEKLHAQNKLHPDYPLMEGVVNPHRNEVETASVRGRDHLKSDELRRLVYGPHVMTFFERFLGGEPMSFNFQWLRTVGPGTGSTIHYDVVYMGRGTRRLYTAWTPLGDITPEMGSLAVCLGSNRWDDVIRTYGRSDVDRDLIAGHFTDDPLELVDQFGGQWATTTFRAGDVLILNMFIMHASLTNMSNRYRISCDTRYQLASEPVDERWAGKTPVGHTAFWQPGASIEPVAQSRQRWGV